MRLWLFLYLDFLFGCDGCACFFHICRSTAQVYHGLRKVADYKSLSDTGGNTDAVTRKVWAVFLSLIDDLRAKNTTVDEGLMITDGDSALRAVVPDVPTVRQEAARLEIAATQTGDPPPPRSGNRRATRTRASSTSRRRRGSKRAVAADDADAGATMRPPRNKRARKRRARSPREDDDGGDSTAPSYEDDGLPLVNQATLECGLPTAHGAGRGGVGGEEYESGGDLGAPPGADNIQDMLAELRS